MKRFLPWIIAGFILLILFFWVKNINNTGVSLGQESEEAWGNVETAYQKRNALVGNLVNTVKGAAKFEQETFTAVTNARAKATSVQIDPANISPEQLAQFQQAQARVSASLSRLLVSVEQYPELKATKNFGDLQAELTSIENQILTARTRFNESVKKYNVHIKSFPNNLFVGLFGFQEKYYFKSDPGAEKPVEVKF